MSPRVHTSMADRKNALVNALIKELDLPGDTAQHLHLRLNAETLEVLLKRVRSAKALAESTGEVRGRLRQELAV